MDERRKTLGRRIYRARRKAGFRSQKTFAEKLRISEASVANAERGSSSVGDAVFTAIEDGLGWPEDSIAHYLESGDESLLVAEGRVADKPLTELEKLVVLIYLQLRRDGWRDRDARRLAIDIGRQLEQDETALSAAFERESHPAM